DREAELREKVKAAFVYPALVVVASFLVVLFMLLFIVPVFDGVYKQFHATLPPMTQMLIVLSFVFLHYWWMVTIASIGAVMLINRYIKTPIGRKHFDQFKLKMPLLGKLNRKIAIARFTQTFAGVSKAGVPILRALGISANTSG